MVSAHSYASWHHRRVEGWIEPEALRILASLAAEQRRRSVTGGLCEIGVHHGRLFIGLHLLLQPGEQSLAIDLFSDQEGNVDRSGRGDEAVFRDNLRRYVGGDDGVHVLHADSTTIDGADVREALGGQVRLFSVDGGHTAEIVEHDMHTAAHSLTDGGIVIGDDVFNCQWPGVVEGTLGFLRSERKVVPFAVGYNKVLFTTPAFAEPYRDVVLEAAAKHLWNRKSSTMAGYPVAIVWPATIKARARREVKRLLGRV